VSPAFDPSSVAKAMASARWTALVRTGLDAASVGLWDPGLVRESRVLVPVDVQALYVPTGSTEPMARIPLALSAPDGQDPPKPTPVLEDGPPRPAGVHLHWAPPDALLRGTLADSGPTNKLQMPALADRWVVLRLLVPTGADAPLVRGWVLEADTAKAVELDAWPAGSATAAATGRTVPAPELTGSVGGSLNWVGVYDATVNRLAFHDPLDDLATVAPNGVEGDQVAYVVSGWWSTTTLDPLDGAQTTSSLHTRLDELGWALVDDQEGGDRVDESRAVDRLKRESIGLVSSERYAPQAGAVGKQLAVDVTEAVKVSETFKPSLSVFADEATAVRASEPAWPRSALLHGAIYGVPVAGPAKVDNRPAPSQVGVVLGEHGDDVAAALASAGLASPDPEERRALERLLSAFTGNLLDRVGSPDGLVDVEEHEHAQGFVARPGGPGGTDRLQTGQQEAGSAAGRTARADAARVQAGATNAVKITAFAPKRSDLKLATLDDQRQEVLSWSGDRPEVEPAAQAREVIRPAPRVYLPAEPMIAVRGAGRSLRHGGDGRFSPDGRLQCRWPSQVTRGVDQVIQGADLLASLATSALPDEVLLLAREALITNPYLAPWVARIAAERRGLDPAATTTRLFAEATLRFGADATYDGRTAAFAPAQPAIGAAAPGFVQTRLDASIVADQLRRFSLFQGTDPDPVGVTAWSQPWVPLWLEWEVDLQAADRLDGWQLGQVDYDPAADAVPSVTARTVRGRSPLTTATATAIGSAVRAWLAAEDARDLENAGEADEATEASLTRIADAIENLDAVAASLDGIREQLLGFAYDGGLLRPRSADGTLGPPATTGDPPSYLRDGTLALTRARLVDAFGRTLELPTAPLVAVRSDVPDAPGVLRLRPRITVPARLLFRLVDAAVDGPQADEARVDQIDATKMVNPVAGFLLPDHIDEALETFDVAGTPLGQLMNAPIGGGVAWEIAPGRPGPADAGPLFDLQPGARHVGLLAAGMVAADARARDGHPADPDGESALSALLRAIDTTLWSVDAFRALGSEHIAGLVGRPIAVVRARLTLDLVPDLGLDAAAAMAALADRAVTVRLGEITRADDGLLAYVVDDDYDHVRVVDKVVASMALDSGPQRGQLGRYGTTPQVPPTRPIEHPYILAEDELAIRPGQTVTLTLLMNPGGSVHLTSGVLPRKSLALARDWVAPGLSVMAPSARIGPVLIDPAQVTLPKVSAFPKDQLFTRRDTPSSWKDDPILAATQTALLPDLPYEVQEGYIRIAPDGGSATP
jgi:hypothetical protein